MPASSPPPATATAPPDTRTTSVAPDDTAAPDGSSAGAGSRASPPEPSPAGGRSRLGWLDALRGLAALVVVFEHSLDVLFPEVRKGVSPWFDFGRYGVFVFFTVSGYIVPASLERRGSVREFWIGRMFRLYPLWAVAAVISVGIGLAGLSWSPPHQLTERPGFAALAHLTMLQDLLATPNAVNVFWTLSYEMVFYLLVTAMFVAGAHRASAGTALTLAAGAAAVGAVLPLTVLSDRSWGSTIAGTALLMGAGLLALMSRNRVAKRCGVAMLGVLALVLATVNSRIGGVESLAIIATMFAGTAIYRVQHGQARGWRPVAMIAAVPVLTVAAGAGMAITERTAPWQATGVWGWPAAVAAAWLTFLAGLALRGRRIPRFLPWLGVISYSVYLLHSPVVQIIWRVIGEPEAISVPVRLLWLAVLVIAVLVTGALAHRHIELPAQRIGRRLIRLRRDRRARGRARERAREAGRSRQARREPGQGREPARESTAAGSG